MLSVIIPTRNEAKRLPRCLDSLSKQTFTDFEVIIVDSNSTDETKEIAESSGARVVNEPRKGVAIAKNTGVKSAKGDIIVFTDADTTHPIDWLKKVNKRFDDPKVACVFGALRPEDGDLIDQAVFFLSSDLLPAATYPLGFMIAHSPNLSFRRSVLVACGGYDERLIILEDNELPNRLKNRGKVVFDPKLWVFASARRFHNEGYMKPFIRFMKGYWSVYVSKEAQKCEYPEFR